MFRKCTKLYLQFANVFLLETASSLDYLVVLIHTFMLITLLCLPSAKESSAMQ